jgi:hypothetical protein
VSDDKAKWSLIEEMRAAFISEFAFEATVKKGKFSTDASKRAGKQGFLLALFHLH